MGRFVERPQVGIHRGGWDLGPEDHDVERALLPSEVGGGGRLSNGLNDLGPLSLLLATTHGLHGRSRPCRPQDLEEKTHVEYLDVGSGGVVVSQALQSYQALGQKLVRRVYRAEIEKMGLFFVRGHDEQVVLLGTGTRQDAGASDQILDLLEMVDMARELCGGGSGRDHSHDLGRKVGHTI